MPKPCSSTATIYGTTIYGTLEVQDLIVSGNATLTSVTSSSSKPPTEGPLLPAAGGAALPALRRQQQPVVTVEWGTDEATIAILYNENPASGKLLPQGMYYQPKRCFRVKLTC